MSSVLLVYLDGRVIACSACSRERGFSGAQGHPAGSLERCHYCGRQAVEDRPSTMQAAIRELRARADRLPAGTAVLVTHVLDEAEAFVPLHEALLRMATEDSHQANHAALRRFDELIQRYKQRPEVLRRQLAEVPASSPWPEAGSSGA